MRRFHVDSDDKSYERRPWEVEDSEWLPKSAIEGLALEEQTHPGESEESRARRLFRENSPAAALSITHMAMHGSNERIRLDASKYVIERVLGRVGDDAYDGEKSPIESFVNDVIGFAHAQGGSK
jgi:hypothetical protein